jgi:hypothetical protein
MTPETPIAITPRMEEALSELEELIRRAHPEAEFTVGEGDDPAGVYLTATVDVDDRGEVIDLFMERLIALQVEEGLPIFVIPVRPPARNLALAHQQDSAIALANL